MKYDIIIIGSGLGGLECAHFLSKAGKSVLLLEQAKHAGGCMQSYTRQGQTFDTGLHYVGGLDEGQSLHSIFKSLGLLKLPWHRMDQQFDRILIEDRLFAFSQGYDSFVQTLSSEFPKEHTALLHYTEVLKKASYQQYSLLNPICQDFMDLPEGADVNAWQYLQNTFHDSMLINVLSGTSLKMELRKESLPLFTFAHGNSSFIESSWRLKGDGSLIVNSLINDIRAQGGDIICASKVDELVEDNGKIIRAHCANGESYEGDIFISDIHPVQTCHLVKNSNRIKKIYRHRMDTLQNTYGMFTVSICLHPQTLKYFNWNQFIYRQPNVWDFYQTNCPISGVMVSCRIPEDESEFTRQIDLLTPMSWSQCVKWSDTKVGCRGEEYKTMKERIATECITLTERFIPGLRKMISSYSTSTPLTYRDYLLSPEGTAYGIRKDCTNPLQTILSVRTPIPNLLLTGQSLMLHGVHGVTMTALFTCTEILGKKYIWNMITK